MQTTLVLQNLLSAPVLFFFLGILAVVSGSDLEIPSPLPKLFSLYLLLAIGFKGGVELSESGLGPMVLMTLGAAILMSLVVPLTSFLILRTQLGPDNAAAVAAAYGSISAVTFITAQSFLNVLKISYDGFMVAALALMESPAIVVGVVMAKLASSSLEKGQDDQAPNREGIPWREVLQEAFLNGSVFLLIGSLVIGALVAHFNPAGVERMAPFTEKLFYGVLCFFLLDMGLMVARNFADARKSSPVLIAYAAVGPLVHAGLALLLGAMLGMSAADVAILMVLSASASYIVVPAVLRYAIPEANPSLYFGLSLGITFPLNILVGIPLYAYVAKTVLG